LSKIINCYKWEALVNFLKEKERKSNVRGKKENEKKDNVFARLSLELEISLGIFFQRISELL